MTDSATYIPKPNSLPWRILTWMVLNPEEELTRRDIAVKFDTQPSTVDTTLGIAVARQVMKRTRNADAELCWSLGPSTNFVLESCQTEDDPVRLPARCFPAARAPAVAPVTVLDLDNIKVRKGVRLLSPEERRRQEFIDWFDQFDVGDSAEFDDEHAPTIRIESARHRKAKQTAWKIAVTGPGRSGIERTA